MEMEAAVGGETELVNGLSLNVGKENEIVDTGVLQANGIPEDPLKVESLGPAVTGEEKPVAVARNKASKRLVRLPNTKGMKDGGVRNGEAVVSGNVKAVLSKSISFPAKSVSVSRGYSFQAKLLQLQLCRVEPETKCCKIHGDSCGLCYGNPHAASNAIKFVKEVHRRLPSRQTFPAPFSTVIVGDEPILVRDFIRSALYDPTHGYFSQQSDPVGMFERSIRFNQLAGIH